jgi:hypothetical protein
MAYRNDEDRDRGRDWRDDEYGRDPWFREYQEKWSGREGSPRGPEDEGRWERERSQGERDRGHSFGRWYGRFGPTEGVGSAAGYSGMGGPGWTSGGHGDPGYNTSGFSSSDYGTSRTGGSYDRSASREPMPFSRADYGGYERPPSSGPVSHWDREPRWGSADSGRGTGRWEEDRDYAYSREAENRWNRGPHIGRGPKGYQRTDERIREEISDRLMDHGGIDASGMEVTVEKGEVTLSGTVEDRRSKRLAEDVADSVRGVKDVHNRLSVGKLESHDREMSLTPEAEQLDKKMSGSSPDKNRK